MAYDYCYICEEKVKANPLHVKVKHAMTWEEYKAFSTDIEFLEDVERKRKENKDEADKAYSRSRLLLYQWFPRAKTLTGVMERFGTHAKTVKKALTPNVDTSPYKDKKEAIVGNVLLSDALIKEGWECTGASGGYDGKPKRYYMKKVV